MKTKSTAARVDAAMKRIITIVKKKGLSRWRNPEEMSRGMEERDSEGQRFRDILTVREYSQLMEDIRLVCQHFGEVPYEKARTK